MSACQKRCRDTESLLLGSVVRENLSPAPVANANENTGRARTHVDFFFFFYKCNACKRGKREKNKKTAKKSYEKTNTNIGQRGKLEPPEQLSAGIKKNNKITA